MSFYQKENSIIATFYLMFFMVLMYVLNRINPAGFYHFFVLKQNFENFYFWQILTYIFYDSTDFLYYFFKIIILFWFSSTLESTWGTGRFVIFILITILSKSIVAVILNFFIGGINFELVLNGYDSLLNPNSFFLCLMIAFGFQYSNEVIYLFFILPVRVKVLAIISMILAMVQILLYFIPFTNLYASLVYATIQLSGYISLLFYSKLIFGFSLFNFKSFTLSQFTTSKKRLEKILEENEKLLNGVNSGINNENSNNQQKEKIVLCDEIDFDENDQYCRKCDKFVFCKERKEQKS